MSTNQFKAEFKRDAVVGVEDRGNPVREVAAGLGVSTTAFYTMQKPFSRPAKVGISPNRAWRLARLAGI